MAQKQHNFWLESCLLNQDISFQVLTGLSNWLLETGAKDESLVVAGEALDKFIDVYSEDTQVGACTSRCT